MKKYFVLFGLSLTLSMASSGSLFAQAPWYASPYGVHPGGYGYGYGAMGGGFGTAQTPYSAAASGMGNLVRAEGAYNAMTATAMRQEEQARSQAIDNRQKAYENHQKNVRQRAAMNEQKKEQEQKADQASRARVQEFEATHRPPPLSNDELNPSTGAITWPGPLKDLDYLDYRKALESLFQTMAKDGLSTGLSDQITAKVGELKDVLRRHIKDMPLPEYSESRKFLDRMASSVH